METHHPTRFLRRRFALLSVLALCCTVPGFAQEPNLRFENITVNDGLSDGSVQAILQDHLGYLWFGTADGLDRFDGYEFRSYKPSPSDSTSISEGVINGLYEDDEGTLWITTSRGGLDLFDATRKHFTHYTHDPNDPNSLGHDVLCKVHPSRSDAVWVCTLGGGLDRFDPETETFEHYRNVPRDSTSLSNNYVYDAYEDPSGYTWVATGNGLNRLTPDRTAFSRYFYTPGDADSPSPHPEGWFRYIHPDPDDPYLLWLGSGAGLVRFDTRTARHRRYLDTFVYAITDDPNVDGVLWLAAARRNGGLFRFDTRSGKHVHYRHDPQDPYSLISNELFSIFADRSGMIWTGSANGRGVSRFDPRGAPFEHYRPGVKGGLSLPAVSGIQEDKQGRLWLAVRDAGGRGELNRLDRAAGEVKTYAHDPNNPASLSLGAGYPLHVDRRGRIWVGTNDGIEQLDPETGSVKQVTRDTSGPRRMSWQTGSWNNVTTIYEAHSGDLWLGTTRGLFRLRAGEFERFIEDPGSLEDGGRPQYVPRQDVQAILEDRDGTLWIGTLGGLYRLDPETGRYQRFVHDPRNPDSLSENLVYALHQRRTEPAIIWVGTRNGGLNRFNIETSTAQRYTTEDGLPNNRIYAILEDDRGRLWMSTNRGISSFDPEAGLFRNYGIRHGLQSMEFNRAAAFRSRSGEMFFGGPNGLNAFYPDRPRPNPRPPDVVISEFRLVGESAPDRVLSSPIGQTPRLRLQHNENALAFSFTAFHYQEPEQNQYAYRLDPVDDDWIEAGSRRSAAYSRLAPGAYTFRVKAANSDGVWSPKAARMAFVIAPPWWRTGWAYGLYVVFFGLGVLAVDRVQRQRLLVQERERARIREARLRAEAAQDQAATLQQLDTLKSRFFANLSHEFRTPLTLILDPLEQMIKRSTDEADRRRLRMMRRQARRLLHLVGQLLDLSKLDAGGMTLRAREMDLVPFLRGLVYAFASRAEREDIALQFSSTEERALLCAEPDKLEKVFTNLLTNAFKFTPSHGKIRVGLSKYDDAVEVTVKDTGQGISEDEIPHVFDRFYQVDASLIRRHEGAGIGLALTKELIELHGGTVRVESEPGFGTTFIVRLRTGCAHLRSEQILEDGDGAAGNGEVVTDGTVGHDEGEILADSDDLVPEDAPLVLIVEDNDEVRAYLRSHLSAHYRITEAKDGIDGLEKARQLSPKLVLVDVMMPRMDGYAFCRTLKSSDDLGHVPVILLTAKASQESKVEGLDTGADDYIYKPFSMSELLVRIENLIEVRRALRERFSKEVVVRPSGVTVPSEDAVFVDRVRKATEAELSNSEFTVEMLAEAVGVSTRTLYRKIKAATRLSPGGFIRTMRLQRAAQLLVQDAGNISSVAHAVGFKDADYFSRLFRQVFGQSPSEYVANRP